MKHTLTAILLGLGLSAFANTPTITDVTARQRYPWNGKVDITYTVTGDVAAEAATRGLVTPTIQVTATDRTTGNTYSASSLSGDTSFSAGMHALVWDMNADGLIFQSDDVFLMLSAKPCQLPTASSTFQPARTPRPIPSRIWRSRRRADSTRTNTKRQN